VAIETLTSLSRGIYPSVLSDDGLEPALRSAVGSSAIPVVIKAEDLGRLPASVEAALYFCCMEAVQNAAKHSGAGTVTVRLGGDRRQWRLVVVDDGSGFDLAQVRGDGGGAGLLNMRDRLDAVGGTVSLGSRSGEGTTVTAVVPMTRGG
jgi:signal transduction histidine kinase